MCVTNDGGGGPARGEPGPAGQEPGGVGIAGRLSPRGSQPTLVAWPAPSPSIQNGLQMACRHSSRGPQPVLPRTPMVLIPKGDVITSSCKWGGSGVSFASRP